MKAKNASTSLLKRTVETDWMGNKSTSTAFMPGSHRDVVTRVAGVVNGDFVSPNAFSYETDLELFPQGYTSDSSADSTPQSFVQIERYGSCFASASNTQRITLGSFAESWIYNSALDRLNSKVRGNLDLATSLADSGATFRMIKKLASFKRFFAGVGTKRWANEWLELQYGWKPLLSDIYGAAEESVRVVLNEIEHVQALFRAIEPPICPIVVGQLYFPGAVPVRPVPFGKYYRGTRLGMSFKTAEDNLQSWSRWASCNPLSIAWELCPYSFVADWFVDVGGYLRNFETSLLYNNAFVSGFRSDFTVLDGGYTSRGSFGPYVSGARSHMYNWDIRYARRYSRFRRTVLTSYPLPDLPTFKVDLGSNQLLSAAALIRQKLR